MVIAVAHVAIDIHALSLHDRTHENGLFGDQVRLVNLRLLLVADSIDLGFVFGTLWWPGVGTQTAVPGLDVDVQVLLFGWCGDESFGAPPKS